MAGGFEGEALIEAPAEWPVARSLLMSNPSLLCDDIQLLQALGLRPAANVVEFGPAALARLEAARAREISARQELEAMARANHSAQAQTHALVVDILDAKGHLDLARRVNEGVRERFALEAGALAIEGQAPAGWRGLPFGLLDYILGADRLYAVGACTGGREIFGEAAERVKSVALVRIALFDPLQPGVLAFGSADAEGFTSDMGVELIAFIARVVERTAERWPVKN